MTLATNIEAVLFYRADPVKKSELISLLETTPEEFTQALAELQASLSAHALHIVETDTSVQMVTAPHVSELIERVRKEELSNDIGKAGAETLAIILYRGPLSRIEVDRIRGVNSTFIIRNLLIRGLIERRPHPTDSRSFIYATTPELLNNLGITRREDMPEFGEIMNALDQFEKDSQQDIEETNPLTQA
jgi:segregation and condensation protein B